MDILLSICIATRNRGDVLGETLASIAKQWRPAVEIVVLDGASTDRTAEVVAHWQTQTNPIRYVFKSENGGVDQDFDECVMHATGAYCWLMSDDDLLLPGAIDAVLRTIQQNPDLVVVNSELRNTDFSELIIPNRLNWREDRAFTTQNTEQFFREVSGYLGYIGAVVIKRQVWLERLRAPYYGSCFIHVGVIFQKPLEGKVVVLAEPLVSVRFGNTQWRPREFEIRMIRWTDLIWSFHTVSATTRSKLYPQKPWLSLKSLFFYRAKGTYGLKEYYQWVRPRTDSFISRARGWLVAAFPGWLANLIGLVVCSFPYRESRVHFLDMQSSRFYLPHILVSRKRR